jgi:hypothetical protein
MCYIPTSLALCIARLPNFVKLTQDNQILGDALIAVVFVRNGLAMAIRFSFTSWLAGMGIQHTFILIGGIAFATMIMPIMLLIYGKSARVRTAAKYRKFASRQQVKRSS